jgi:hypothetical protein
VPLWIRISDARNVCGAPQCEMSRPGPFYYCFFRACYENILFPLSLSALKPLKSCSACAVPLSSLLVVSPDFAPMEVYMCLSDDGCSTIRAVLAVGFGRVYIFEHLYSVFHNAAGRGRRSSTVVTLRCSYLHRMRPRPVELMPQSKSGCSVNRSIVGAKGGAVADAEVVRPTAMSTWASAENLTYRGATVRRKELRLQGAREQLIGWRRWGHN